MEVKYFIIGTQKSGTSSLLKYLSILNNQYFSQKQLECSFFYSDDEFKKGEEFLFDNYFFHLPSKRNQNFNLIIKHATAYYYPNSIKRAIELFPNVKFILIFRNPVDRFLSSFLMEKERSGYSNNINEAINIAFSDKKSFEYRSFNQYGQYYKQLKVLNKIIPAENIVYIIYEDFIKNPIETLSNLNLTSNDLGIDENKLLKTNAYSKVRNIKLMKSINSLKKSNAAKVIKMVLPSKYKYQYNKSIEKLLYKKNAEKPKFENEVYLKLKDHYYESIINFEKFTTIKTNWLKND